MFKRQVVEQTTFLFYDHFKSYFEETNFCRRAANCGWETRFVPTPPIDHLCGATSTRFDRDEIWIQYFRNIIFSFARNWGRWGRFVMLPLFCCAAFDKSPRNLVQGVEGEKGLTFSIPASDSNAQSNFAHSCCSIFRSNRLLFATSRTSDPRKSKN